MNKYIAMVKKYEEMFGEDFFDDHFYAIMPENDQDLEKIAERFWEILQANGLAEDDERVIDEPFDFLYAIDFSNSRDRKRFELFVKMLKEEFSIDMLEAVLKYYRTMCDKNNCDEDQIEYLSYLEKLEARK